MPNQNIGGKDYAVIRLNISTPGNSFTAYSCPDCSALVGDPEKHNTWHRMSKANAMGFGAVY